MSVMVIRKTLSLVVVKGKGHNLFGEDSLAHFCLDWKTIGLATLEKSSTALEMLLELMFLLRIRLDTDSISR